MSTPEARVLLARLAAIVADLRDLGPDAPVHVAADAERHIAAIEEARRELAKLHGVTP